MFIDPVQFPFTPQLESSWQVILAEFEQLTPAELMPWPERNLYDQGWDVFGLWGGGQRFDHNCQRCPQTAVAVESIPGMTTAGFSRLAPGTRIQPHRGYTSSVLRCHLGLVIPENCGLQVGSESHGWQAGKCLIFDDTVLHHAWNGSPNERIVLIFDFLRAGHIFDAAVSAEAAEIVRSLSTTRARD